MHCHSSLLPVAFSLLPAQSYKLLWLESQPIRQNVLRLRQLSWSFSSSIPSCSQVSFTNLTTYNGVTAHSSQPILKNKFTNLPIRRQLVPKVPIVILLRSICTPPQQLHDHVSMPLRHGIVHRALSFDVRR